MPPQVLDRRARSRALLARQHLLSRVELPPGGERADGVLAMVEHLAGMQAQAPFPPYFGLWSRLAGFGPADLGEMLTDRRVVRIALMRGTIHLVSARDCLALRPAVQPVLDRGFLGGYAKQLAGVDHGDLAAAGRDLVEAAPRTFNELGTLLAERWPGSPPIALAQGVRALVPLVQVPPRAVWGKAGQARHTSAEAWLGAPLAAGNGLGWLVRKYLAAFGPATVADVQAWSGLTRLREAVDPLRPDLRTFRDEDGRELFDLPDAPRPGPDAPAPARLIAEFDNLVLSHADRSHVISDGHRKRLYTRNGIFPGTVLADGAVVGIWRLSQAAGTATLTIELFQPVPRSARDGITAEGAAMLAFAAPTAAHDIQFAGPT
jgi:hypothetical protein